jgi:hypothetical protein
MDRVKSKVRCIQSSGSIVYNRQIASEAMVNDHAGQQRDCMAGTLGHGSKRGENSGGHIPNSPDPHSSDPHLVHPICTQ